MRVKRLALVIAATASLALPAYAVVMFQSGAGKSQSAILLQSQNGRSASPFALRGMASGSSSMAWFPGSNSSSMTWFPGSGSSSMAWYPGSGGSSMIASVPELSTWSMMVIGFFAIGAVRYRSVRKDRAKSK